MECVFNPTPEDKLKSPCLRTPPRTEIMLGVRNRRRCRLHADAARQRLALVRVVVNGRAVSRGRLCIFCHTHSLHRVKGTSASGSSPSQSAQRYQPSGEPLLDLLVNNGRGISRRTGSHPRLAPGPESYSEPIPMGVVGQRVFLLQEGPKDGLVTAI